MARFDSLPTRKISNCSRHFEDPVVRAGRKSEAIDSGNQQLSRSWIELAVLAQIARSHLRVAAAEARALNLSRGLDAFANRRRRLPRFDRRDLFTRQRRDLDLQIDPIEQRSGDLRQITRDLLLRTDAFAAAVVEESARTWIQRAGQRES